MKKFFVVLLNMLVFFFVMNIFAPTIQVKGIPGFTQNINSILVGLLYGFFMMLVPNILKFFKLGVQTSAIYLMSVLVSFIFFFASKYLLNLINLGQGNITIIPGMTITLLDQTVTIVFLSIFTSIFSVSMIKLSSSK